MSRWTRRCSEAAEDNAEARLLMTHPGVGPVVSLAYVLTIGDWQRFPRGKQVGSYLGLIPAEESSGQAPPGAHQQAGQHAGALAAGGGGDARRRGTIRAGIGSMCGCR